MFFSDWRALLRRWYVVLVGLLVTVGLGVGAALLAPPSYEIKASILLVPPKVAVGTGGNPYLSLGGLEGATDVLSRAMADGRTRQQLVDAGASPDFVVATDPTTAGPVVLVTADAPSTAAAEKTLQLASDEMPKAIKKLQDDAAVPLSSRITLQEISRDRAPLIVRKSQIRAIMLGIAVGVAGTLVSVGFLDGLARRRAENGDRRRPDQGASGGGYPDPHDPGPALFPGADNAGWPAPAAPGPPDQGRRPGPPQGAPVQVPSAERPSSRPQPANRPYSSGQASAGSASPLSQLDRMTLPDASAPSPRPPEGHDPRQAPSTGSPLSAHRRETPRRGPTW